MIPSVSDEGGYAVVSIHVKVLALEKKVNMLQTQARTLSKLWIGIDFHKKTWRVHFRSDLFSGNPFSMEPLPDILHSKVLKEYPDYEIEVVYECGCFGYWAHRKFVSYGWKSTVVNPSDIPRVSKQKFTKTDSIDARNLSKLLKAGLLHSVTVPGIKREQLRSLFRRRVHLVMNTRSIKSRLKASLLYYGFKIPDDLDNASWTKNFRQWVKEVEWEHKTGKLMMLSNINQVEYLHYETNEISNHLRKYCRDHYKKEYDLLRSIPGVGPLTAVCFISEVGDISRFRNFKQLACLVGLMPTTYQSSDTNRTQGLTPRALRIMRSYLVEAAWQAVRIDPVLREYYKKHTGKKSNDIIVKVARKLLSRMYGILRTETEYVIGLIK